MNNTDMLNRIKEIIKKSGQNYNNELHKTENSNVLKWIYDNCPEKLKTGEYNLSTILYWIANGLTDFPKCENCKNEIGVGQNIRFFKGYKKYCKRCASKTKEAIETRKKTCLKKYGVENPLKSKDIIAKIAETNIRKYGSKCPLANDEIRKKMKEDNIKKYGTDCYQKTEEYKEKVRNTCLRKYGKQNVFEVEEIKEKSRRTMIDKYGVEHNSQSKEIREKSKKRLKEKYGENYKNVLWGGNGNAGQNRRAYSYILRNELVIPLFTVEDFIEGKKKDTRTKFKFRCRKCGTEFMSPWDNGGTNKCPNCNHSNGTSEIEKEMVDFIKYTCKCELSENDRKIISPYEIDAVSYDDKICFEMDGLYWHCDEMNKDHKYHLMKTEFCEKNGFQLIHIFENEWKHKNDIVKSRIKSLFGVYDKTLYARKCKVSKVEPPDVRIFLEKNHIQGYCQSSVNLGLYDDCELVSIMTFGKPRFNKKYEWELLRFCNKLGHHVIGGAGKLLKYFERNYSPSSLISYADRRWSRGNLYEKLGFKHTSNTPPNYWYIDFSKLMIYSRVRFQKHKLKTLLESYDEKISEVENMKNNGYGRIFDCGNMVFVKEFV